MNYMPSFTLKILPIIILLVWSSVFILPYMGFTDDTMAKKGDVFGIINALFSGLAFWGMVIAILLQKQELEEQRKEIAASRIAQQQSAQALTQQLALSEVSAKISALNTIIIALEKQMEIKRDVETVPEINKKNEIIKLIDHYREHLMRKINKSIINKEIAK